MQTIEPENLPDLPEPNRKRSGITRFIIDVLETLILSVILFAVINAVSARIRVDGSSMEPTLSSGEYVVVNKLAYKFGSPSITDVVVFHFPRDPQQEYIKRVIGLPGDRVAVSDGRVYVNDVELQEDYITSAPQYEDTWVIPEDAIFVLGDNRNNSSDSHNWGPVPMDYVVGKAVLIYWPPQQWGVIDSPSTAIAAP
ncbi:MAG: signal peptidase I [Anaerolineales bacterium]